MNFDTLELQQRPVPSLPKIPGGVPILSRLNLAVKLMHRLMLCTRPEDGQDIGV